MGILGNTKNPYENSKLFAFTNGVEVDAKLCHQEVRVQKAWAEALSDGQVLTKAETQMLVKTLEEALALMVENKFPWKIEDEDIHMNLERFLTERLGEVG